MNGSKTEYIVDGGQILAEARGNLVLRYLYDDSGAPIGMRMNGVTYLYEKNLQGDIVGICNSSGTCVASYAYDAWGNVVSGSYSSGYADVYNSNPFRYRGYYWDSETGFYYISSRYYDPEVGRWISPEPNVDYGEFDVGSEILGYNVYAYCFNNPVNNFDPNGEAVANIVGGVIGGVAGTALGYLLADALGLKGWKKWALISAATVGGAALGAFLGPYVAKLGGKVAAKLGIKTAKATFKSIAKITSHKMSHINVPKHLWGRVLKKVTNQGIGRLIQRTIKKGVWETLKNGVTNITYKYGGEIIVVTGKVINGIFQVGDAWVKK